MANPGDFVELKTKKETLQGTLLPQSGDVTILKLDNGYNLGVPTNDIVSTKVVKKGKPSSSTKEEVKTNTKLPTIAILHTGGTIASKVDYATGGVSAKFTAADLLSLFPKLGTIANVKTELVANMMSEDMSFEDYQTLAAAIKKYASKVDGIIIGHGTDTLGVTAAALSFMFESLPIPVILVGSQRSSDRGSSDAQQNLLCAAHFITQTDFAGVAICMHADSSDEQCAILPATKTRKMHTSRRDAFKAINAGPIAYVNVKSGNVGFVQNEYSTKGKKTVLKEKLEPQVGLLKTHPGMDPKLFEFYTKQYKGIVLEGTGLGHAPTHGVHEKSYLLLKKFIEKGGVVAVTSQCLFGAVNPHVYTNLRRLAEIGCVFCYDMLPETAFVKLAWLLANEKNVVGLLNQNLRGEISENLYYEEEFLKK